MASAFGSAFASWQASVKVPDLPWYPAFAVFPAPFAPPTPNVPTPLSGLAQNAGAFGAVAGAGSHLADPVGAAVAQAVGRAIATAANGWLSSTMVTNVMGSGPVPAFAPPYIPASRVVNGIGNQVPGGMT